MEDVNKEGDEDNHAVTMEKIKMSKLFLRVVGNEETIKYLDENFLISLAHLIFKTWTKREVEDDPFECFSTLM